MCATSLDLLNVGKKRCFWLLIQKIHCISYILTAKTWKSVHNEESYDQKEIRSLNSRFRSGEGNRRRNSTALGKFRQDEVLYDYFRVQDWKVEFLRNISRPIWCNLVKFWPRYERILEVGQVFVWFCWFGASHIGLLGKGNHWRVSSAECLLTAASQNVRFSCFQLFRVFVGG